MYHVIGAQSLRENALVLAHSLIVQVLLEPLRYLVVLGDARVVQRRATEELLV